jgi:class 3 adenylate cyclase
VTFNVSPSIRQTQPGFKVFLPGNVQQFGRYETTAPFAFQFDLPFEYFLMDAEAPLTGGMAKLDVQADTAPCSAVTVTFHSESATPPQTVMGPGLTTINAQGTSAVLVMGRTVGKITFDDVVTGSDVMLTPDFKNVFSRETLSQRESLSIRHLTILFTDITGSTALYQRLGDVPAYNLVRDHFDVLFQQIERHQGVVVKTIGDAVMAAFPAPDYALQAALAVQHDIRQFNEPRTPDQGIILVKIGLHTGNAIAVNLNNTLDYFGNMVNQAARIQSKSRSEEVLLSEDIFNDAGVQNSLAARSDLVLSDSVFELQGIGEHRLFSVMTRLSATIHRS